MLVVITCMALFVLTFVAVAKYQEKVGVKKRTKAYLERMRDGR